MNTPLQKEFYEDTLYQLGHISAEVSQLLKFLSNQEINPSVIQNVKSQILRYDRVIIDKLGVAERSIRDVRAMIEQWAAACDGPTAITPTVVTRAAKDQRTGCRLPAK